MAGITKLGLSLPAAKLTDRPYYLSSRGRHGSIKMAVSVDEQKKTFTLQKSEQVFNAAKVCLLFYLFVILL